MVWWCACCAICFFLRALIISKVAFDEAVQQAESIVSIAEASSYPYVLHRQSLSDEPKSQRMLIVLRSLVQTTRFWMSFGSGKPWDHQEAVLPPKNMYGTDGVTVCKTLLLGLENRIFGWRP